MPTSRNSKTTSEFDVLVSGAGMIGGATACLFAKQGLKVGLIDSSTLQQWHEDQDYGRVSAINIASMNLFRQLDIWDDIEAKRPSPYHAMEVWEHQSNASISFDRQSIGQAQLGYIIENSAIISSLADKLRQNYNVKILENTTLVGRQIEHDRLIITTDDNKSIACKLLVGADGARSKVREICDIDAAYFDYEQDAIVTCISSDKSHCHTAWQTFLPSGPVALLPLTDGSCSIVWSCDRSHADRLMSLSDQQFCSELTGYFGTHLGEINTCTTRFRFPLEQYHAVQYISRFTALVGDAAHVTHPLAGLGANIGFMDAAALAEVVQDAMGKNQNISKHSVLRRYERWRKGDNGLVLNMMKGFKILFGQTTGPAKTARQAGLKVTDQILPLKNQFARYAMGLSGDIPEICKQ